MLWLIATSAALMTPLSHVAQAQAVVRIERPARASPQDWRHRQPSQRREVIVEDERGSPIRLRLVEYQ